MPVKEYVTVDMQVRQPLKETVDQEFQEEIEAQVSNVLAHIPATDDKLTEIMMAQEDDETIQKLKEYTRQDGPKSVILIVI